MGSPILHIEHLSVVDSLQVETRKDKEKGSLERSHICRWFQCDFSDLSFLDVLFSVVVLQISWRKGPSTDLTMQVLHVFNN